MALCGDTWLRKQERMGGKSYQMDDIQGHMYKTPPCHKVARWIIGKRVKKAEFAGKTWNALAAQGAGQN